jgi:conjugal transfer pilin signal peptidase TrbI
MTSTQINSPGAAAACAPIVDAKDFPVHDVSLARVQRGPFLFAFLGAMAIVVLFWSKLPISLGFDPNDEKCLPDLHLALMVHHTPHAVHIGDLVFWAPRGELNYVKQQFVLKQVAGIPGDHVVIKGQEVFINGVLRASGLPLAVLYHRRADQLARDEVIPAGKVFVLGTHPRSDDSRYWGYVELGSLDGFAYKLL